MNPSTLLAPIGSWVHISGKTGTTSVWLFNNKDGREGSWPSNVMITVGFPFTHYIVVCMYSMYRRRRSKKVLGHAREQRHNFFLSLFSPHHCFFSKSLVARQMPNQSTFHLLASLNGKKEMYLDDAVGHVNLLCLADEEGCRGGIVGGGLTSVDAEVFAEPGHCRMFIRVLCVWRHSLLLFGEGGGGVLVQEGKRGGVL